MGTAMNLFCCEGNDKPNNNERKENYFIKDSDTSAPQTIMDIKIDTKNFIKRSYSNFYDIYEKKQLLGEGAFGSVYKIIRKHSGNREIIRALKEISKDALNNDSASQEEFRNEIEVLKTLDHPNIMKIYEFFEDEKYIYIIFEFCGGGDIAEMNNKYGIFPEFLLKYVMFQVFLAISFLHSKKVVHGDLKRENIAFVYTDEKKDKKEIDNFLKYFF